MGEMGNAAQEELYKSTSSVARSFDASLREKAKDQAIRPNEVVKSEVAYKIPPCLNFGAEGRNLGEGAKSGQPPLAKTERKAEMDTEHVSAEKKNRPNNYKRNKYRIDGKQRAGSECLAGWNVL